MRISINEIPSIDGWESLERRDYIWYQRLGGWFWDLIVGEVENKFDVEATLINCLAVVFLSSASCSLPASEAGAASTFP